MSESKFEEPEFCDSSRTPNMSLLELQSLYKGETILIQDDLVMEAYVISSDRQGNFFGSLHIQDLPQNPSSGVEVLMDLPDTYLFYPPGRRIVVSLEGMYLGKDRGNFQLGGVSSFFGQQKVGRLPGILIENHLQLSCKESTTVLPKSVTLERIQNEKPSTYVQIDSIQFPEDLVDLQFAEIEKETTRILEDCYGNTIELQTSGYSDFATALLPEGRGAITGVLSKEGDQLKIFLNELSDVKLTLERCPTGPEPVTSNELLISEIADPDNNSEARFIELYNAGDEELPLVGWTLERYTNSNTQAGSVIDLSDLVIETRKTTVIASNALVFEEVFGFIPHLEGGKNSAADSNGDDNIVLKDPFGTVIDIFGRIGEDGSGTDHEFEDGKAMRRLEINRGNTIYDPNKWILFNDTGLAGTFNQPQQAPEDFTPGKR